MSLKGSRFPPQHWLFAQSRLLLDNRRPLTVVIVYLTDIYRGHVILIVLLSSLLNFLWENFMASNGRWSTI